MIGFSLLPIPFQVKTMPAIKSFPVLGDHVDMLVTSEMTGGASATLLETSPPGGGPPPHRHENEDETFFIVEGEYELLVDGEWVKGHPGEAFYRARGTVHGFRNSGTSTAKMLIFVEPGGFQKYLEEISPLSVPADLGKLIDISNRYGVFFPGISDNPAILGSAGAVGD
jgi:quercetin dioxygenase-like cupin family protein